MKVEIIGGPRDGAMVPHRGPEFKEPVPLPARVFPPGEELSAEAPFRVRVYDLKKRRRSARSPIYLVYVLRPEVQH